jgi:hypothetical protein
MLVTKWIFLGLTISVDYISVCTKMSALICRISKPMHDILTSCSLAVDCKEVNIIKIHNTHVALFSNMHNHSLDTVTSINANHFLHHTTISAVMIDYT